MKAIVMERYGAAEVLQFSERKSSAPGSGEVRIDVVAAGVNYMDIGTREGLFKLVPLPFTPGVEGVGRVAEVGADVVDFKVGDRVAWFFVWGSYAEQLIAPAHSLVHVPEGVSDETAAGLLMQGLTAHHFVTETYAIQPGDTALVHSAAGGVGMMLSQMIKLRGGQVIGRVSSADKVKAAEDAGADQVIVADYGDFSKEVLDLTRGEGVAVVYDGVGADTFYASLASLRHHGVLAYYGHTIKALPPIDLRTLPRSVLVSYPTVGDHVRTRSALVAHTTQLFDWIKAGNLKVNVGQTYPLHDAPRAHEDIQSRRTTGKLLLRP
ncbi:alcohol dehydrogenase (plasmid) [Burkholderia sp. PAMC 26561]|nr:quinone oxidoreductase [Burkholderia sp. PAMC 26561]AME26989.1 alcohol dehydrogenase [Burkholderia sp. PAMC 26561]AME27866.1 alcohol dehydrogenase [Burkholderia sp. PAMC 26561]